MSLLIKNGRVIDPANGVDRLLDVFVENGMIVTLGNGVTMTADELIDASGKWVTPGLIDLHVHLREPGYEQKETIYDGTRSAAAGGFTTICCMPNTEPTADNPEVIKLIKNKADKEGIVNVLPIGAITVGRKGLKLADMEGMAESGACAFSDDGSSVNNALLMKQALSKAAELNMPIFSHCEESSLVNNGVVNEGVASEKYNLPGISNDSESVMIARDIMLCSNESRLHICHVSTSESVEILNTAKKCGIKVTAEVCPHHFTLSDEDILTDDGNYKMNPPLRFPKDVAQIKRALKENIIEVIATDHAPHEAGTKNLGLMGSSFGIVGLETAVGLCISELVGDTLTPLQLVEKLTTNPARILGINKGTLSIGCAADITIIDPQIKYVVDPNGFYSKGRNTPFGGRTLTGKAICTIVNGKIVYGGMKDEY